MTANELKTELIGLGWIAENDALAGGRTPSWYAWRRIQTTDCECNDKPPSLCLFPWEWDRAGNTSRSCELNITGERGGAWFSLKAYCISMDTAIENLPAIEGALIRAWEAI